MKKYLLAGGLSTTLLLGACGGAEEESTEAEETDNTEELEQLEAENEELELQVEELEDQLEEQEESEDVETEGGIEESDAGTRSEPLSVGETGMISILTYADDEDMTDINGTAEITVDNVVRGREAEDILTSEYSEPEEAPEGLEWVVFDVEFALTELSDEDEEISFSDDFEIITEDGSTVEKAYETFDEEFGVQNVYEGGTAEGKVALHAPEREPFIINYDDYMEAAAYFQVD